jgi:Plasmid pRiA4b ORF-3-like protein
MAKRKTSTAGASASGKKAAKPAAKAEPVKKTDAVYQLKITLRDIRPPIWRRVQVKDCTLSQLHEIIQVAMGWEFSHLYSFDVNGVDYGDPEMTGGELDMEDDRRAKLSRLVPGEKFRFHYTYDFGDNWEHEILVEKILPREEGRRYPVCVDGKRACPPEDVGAAWGYHEFVEAIRNPDHPEHEERLEWAGGEFDPEAFDIDAVNQKLTGRR